MPMKSEREYRALVQNIAPAENKKRIDSAFYVEGYAARFEPYPLYTFDGETIYERFERDCFAGCDMSDIIMQYDHCGRVYARQSNGSLLVEVNDNGLFIAADLGRTDGAKLLYEDIAAGMITKMSWAFTVGECEFDEATNTIVHKKVKKIYDVSAVSIPANNDTVIGARSADKVGGVSDYVAEEFRKSVQRKRIKLLTILGG